MDGTEIELSKVCDFIVHCPDKDDEIMCGDCTFELGKCMIEQYFLYHFSITTLTLNQWNTCSSRYLPKNLKSQERNSLRELVSFCIIKKKKKNFLMCY